MRGQEAKDLLRAARLKRAPLSSIEIPKEQAVELFPAIAELYLKRICRRFLPLESAPSPVQTVLFSLCNASNEKQQFPGH